jgi:hypothetical protein
MIENFILETLCEKGMNKLLGYIVFAPKIFAIDESSKIAVFNFLIFYSVCLRHEV